MLTEDIMDDILAWLLAGDPAIRWQVRRDLLDEPPDACELERTRVADEGWGAALLARQDPTGTWGGGLYGPKWISTTYILLLLRHLGLPAENAQARRGCGLLVDKGFYRLYRSHRTGQVVDPAMARIHFPPR